MNESLVKLKNERDMEIKKLNNQHEQEIKYLKDIQVKEINRLKAEKASVTKTKEKQMHK